MGMHLLPLLFVLVRSLSRLILRRSIPGPEVLVTSCFLDLTVVISSHEQGYGEKTQGSHG